MVLADTSGLSKTRQCALQSLGRTSLYYKRSPSERRVYLLQCVDEIYTEHPSFGTRSMCGELRKRGIYIGRGKASSLMRELGLEAIYCKPNTSKPHPGHKIYPYLLRGMEITKVNQVWSTDITYIRHNGGFVYLTAVIDWYSRYVLSWRLSTTLETGFCVDALKEAIANYGTPEYFNTDQGSQFTSDDFISVLKEHKTIKISMDGRGRALDNVFVERLWRTVKYEDIFLRDYRSVTECRNGLAAFFEKYNTRRVHQSLDYQYPKDVYFAGLFGGAQAA